MAARKKKATKGAAAKKSTRTFPAGSVVATGKKPTRRRSEVGRKRSVAQRQAGRGKPEGGKAFRPTPEQRQQVELMVGMGLTYKQIAILTINPETGGGISTTTLQRAFSEELETGAPKVYAKVVSSLLKKATSDHHPQAAACAMFFLKCRHGWRQEDKIVHEVEGTGVLVAPAAMTPEQWIARQASLDATKEPPGRDGHD